MTVPLELSTEDRPVDPRKLLPVLVELFSENELKELCFDLAVDYEVLSPGSKRDKARELITFLGRRHRLKNLVDILREKRPHLSLEDILGDEGDEDLTSSYIQAPPASTAFVQDRSNTIIAGQGFVALIRLLNRPEVRTAVVAFQTDFQACSERIDLMYDYKLVHDLLQEVENRYLLIYNDKKRLPQDDLAWESIALNEPELKGKIKDLLNAVNEAKFAVDERRWAQQLAKVAEDVHQATEEYDLEKLRSGTRLLYRILNRQPSRINAQLVASASALRLDALEKAMTTVCQNLLENDIGLSEIVKEIQSGVGALNGLDKRLKELVQEHNAWQEVDDELRRIEATIVQGIEELEDAWFDLDPMTRAIYNDRSDQWAVDLGQTAADLAQALNDQTAIMVRRLFRRFRSQITRRFRQVDQELLALCQDLQRVGGTLEMLLRQFNK